MLVRMACQAAESNPGHAEGITGGTGILFPASTVLGGFTRPTGMFPRSLLLKVWPGDQQHQHHLGAQ